MSTKDITAIILAAGQGTRLRPLTDEIPKCMVKVKDKPILNWQLDTLESAGIKKIIVVTGYKENKINDPRIIKVFNEDYSSTNMVYSLFCAEKYLKGNVIITYGDIIYSEEVLEKQLQDQRDIVIASDKGWKEYWETRCDNPLTDAESFKKGENGKVKSLGKKAKSIDEIEGQFIGMLRLSPKGSERVKKVYYNCKKNEKCSINAWGSKRSIDDAYMTDLLNHLTINNELYFNEIFRNWFEIDNLVDLNIAVNNVE